MEESCGLIQPEGVIGGTYFKLMSSPESVTLEIGKAVGED